MGIGTSIFLFAVGAILRFAVNVSTNGFNIHAVGVILMLVGIIGALISLAFWSSWGGFGRGLGNSASYAEPRDTVVVEREPRPRDTVVVEREQPVTRRRTTVVERETRA